MQKIYVLDTNVLLCDPASILSFADRDVVIPMTVIEELDKKRTKPENWVIMQGKYSASCRISVKRAVYGKEWKWSMEEKFL